MSPSYYADGVLETLKNIENAIVSLRAVVKEDALELRKLQQVRHDLREKVKILVGTLGLLQSMPNSGVGVWVIHTKSNKYYQYLKTELFKHEVFVYMVRPNSETNVDVKSFNKDYRLANPYEVEQHEAFLKNKYGNTSFVGITQKVTSVPVSPFEKMQTIIGKPSIDPSNCEFYMVTCTGEHGSKVRHNRYDLAEKEALRIANVKKHPAWIVGVVAKVEPEVKTTFNVKKSW